MDIDIVLIIMYINICKKCCSSLMWLGSRRERVVGSEGGRGREVIEGVQGKWSREGEGDDGGRAGEVMEGGQMEGRERSNVGRGCGAVGQWEWGRGEGGRSQGEGKEWSALIIRGHTSSMGAYCPWGRIGCGWGVVVVHGHILSVGVYRLWVGVRVPRLIHWCIPAIIQYFSNLKV